MAKNKEKITDWESYYSKSKSPVSTFTQRFTENYLINVLKKHNVSCTKIMECGGGNSCFASSLCEQIHPVKYDIIDNCEISIVKSRSNPSISNAYNINLLNEISDKHMLEYYDMVYSVGLAEHFSDDERKIIIENHFKLCKKGGVVLITVPTPTFKYKVVRKCMEFLHVWQFFDERPLYLQNLQLEMETYGEILDAGINYKLPLTQAVVVARKK